MKGLRFHAFIGVGEQERKVGNDYVVDLHLQYPITHAMESDDVADTLNYAEVFEVVKEVMAEPCRLLEYAVHKLVQRLETAFPGILSIDLELCKLNPPMGADCNGASIEVHFNRESSSSAE